MPGIYGVASANPVKLEGIADRMFEEVSSCRDMRLFTRHPVRAEKFAGFSVNNRMFADLKVPHEDDDLLILFDGNVFNLDEIGLSGLTYAQAAAKSYREKGEKFAADFRGHFVIAVLDRRADVLRVYADSAATKPLYYMHHDGVFYFATELKALLPVGPTPKRVDLKSLGQILHSGYVITHRTLVEEATELKAGGLLVYEIAKDRLTKDAYCDHSYHPRQLGRDEHMERMGDALERACDRALRHPVRHGRGILLTITGGMDSRCMAVAAHKRFPGVINGLTHCFHDDFEADYAARICKALDIGHTRVNLDDGDLLRDCLDDTVVAGEAMTHFSDVWRFVAAVKHLNSEEFGMMHTGVPGCAIMGSFVAPSMLNTPHLSIRDRSAVKGILRKLGHFTHPLSNDMFFEAVGDGSDHWETVYDSVADVAGEVWQGPDEWAYAQERVVLHVRQVRGSSGIFRGIEERMDFSAPFWDMDLVRCMMEMPADVKALAGIYYEFLRERFLPRALAKLPNTRNFGPLRRNTSLAWFEWRWKRRLLRGVLGRLSGEFRRKYGCSFQYVVQRDTEFRNFMADMLEDFEVPTACGVDGKKWKRVVNEWRRNPASHLHLTRHFFWLMYLRRWFDLWGKYVSMP